MLLEPLQFQTIKFILELGLVGISKSATSVCDVCGVVVSFFRVGTITMEYLPSCGSGLTLKLTLHVMRSGGHLRMIFFANCSLRL